METITEHVTKSGLACCRPLPQAGISGVLARTPSLAIAPARLIWTDRCGVTCVRYRAGATAVLITQWFLSLGRE